MVELVSGWVGVGVMEGGGCCVGLLGQGVKHVRGTDAGWLSIAHNWYTGTRVHHTHNNEMSEGRTMEAVEHHRWPESLLSSCNAKQVFID